MVTVLHNGWTNPGASVDHDIACDSLEPSVGTE